MTYTMSKDYERLYDLLCGGGEALGLWGSRDVPALDAVWMRKNPHSNEYLMVGRIPVPVASREHFVQECTSWRIEWLAPVDIAEVIRAGDAVNAKLKVLRAYACAYLPDKPLNDVLNDHLGIEEGSAWTDATAKHRTT